MTDQIEVFIEETNELKEFLTNNQLDIRQILEQEGIRVSLNFATDPGEPAGTGRKDPTTVILATAGLVLALTPLLTRVIEAFSHRPLLIKKKLLTESYDEDGNPVRRWVEVPEFIEPQQPTHQHESVVLKGPFKLELAFRREMKGTSI